MTAVSLLRELSVNGLKGRGHINLLCFNKYEYLNSFCVLRFLLRKERVGRDFRTSDVRFLHSIGCVWQAEGLTVNSGQRREGPFY